MMRKNHVILNHVDTPLRILFWTKGELLLFLAPSVAGLLFEQLVMGLLVSGFNVYICRQYKKKFGKGKLWAVLYWYLPQRRQNKGFPPSYVRDYLG